MPPDVPPCCCRRGTRIRYAAILDTYRLACLYLMKFFIRRGEFSLALLHFNAYVAFVPSLFFFFFAYDLKSNDSAGATANRLRVGAFAELRA